MNHASDLAICILTIFVSVCVKESGFLVYGKLVKLRPGIKA